MEYLNSICDMDITTLKSRDKRVKHVLAQIHCQERHDWMIELSGFTKKAIHKPIVYAVSMAQEVADFFELGPPEYSLPFDHLKKLDMDDVSSIVAPQTIEDVVEGVYDMTREEMTGILKSLADTCDKGVTKDYLLSVTKQMAGGRGEGNIPKDTTSSDNEDDMMVGEDYDKEAMELDDIIFWTLKVLRLNDDISVDTKWNPDSKRKGDPYDVIFKLKDDSNEKITGKKSWRNYIKTFGKKVYESKMGIIRDEVSVSHDQGIDDWVFVAYYLLSRSRVFEKRMKSLEHRFSLKVLKELPEMDVEDVIKVFSKVKDEEQFNALAGTVVDTFKDVGTEESFVRQMYDVLWGGTREKHHTPQKSPQKSPKKKRTLEQSHEDVPTQASQKVKTPKKRGRPKKNPEDTTVKKEKKKQKREKETRQSDLASKLAAETLSSLGEGHDFRLPSSSVIRSGFGKIITKEDFSMLANGISSMYNVTWDDMKTYLVSDTDDGHRARYLEIYRKISESLYFDSSNPLTATFEADGQEKVISISQMDVVHFFTEMMIHEKLTTTILNMKAEIDTKRLT